MTQTFNFESALSDLEKVVGELDGDVKLDRALDLFEKGMKLSLDCEKFLKTAEQKIEILRRAANGEVVAVPFEGAPQPVES